MDEIDDLLSSLHEHLEATAEKSPSEELPNELQDAKAIAGDAATGNLDRGSVHERVEDVKELIADIDDTGDETADEHLDAARRAADRILER